MIIALALAALQGPLQGWQFVRPGILSGPGGMALIEEQGNRAKFLIVHDNKKPGEARIAYVTLIRDGNPVYAELKWPGEALPVDLESLSAIPGQPTLFLAGTSAGAVYVLEVKGEALAIKGEFPLPEIPEKSNFEGLTVQTFGSRSLMVWGHRGANPELARLHWCDFDIATLKPKGAVQKQEIQVPWPAAEGARGISDLKLDRSGTLYLTAAADAGDDGPFQSVLYVGGAFQVTGEATFRESNGTRLMWTDQHKIEAFDLVPGKSGGVVFGTDDENLGGYVWSNLWP